VVGGGDTEPIPVSATLAFNTRAVEVPAPPCVPTPRRRPPPLPPPPRDEEDTYPLARRSPGRDLEEEERERERAASRRMLSRAVRDLSDPSLQRAWPLEKYWIEFLAYPLRALPAALVLSVLWATLIAFLGAMMPDQWDAVEVLTRSPVLLVVFVLFGVTVAFLQATLRAALAGKAGFLAMPERDLREIVRGGVQGGLAFLAGPVVPAVVGFIFWSQSGELKGVDWLILWELGLLAVGYWALAMLSVQRRNRLSDLRPAAVMDEARDIGWRAPLVAVLIALPVVGQALHTLGALDRPDRSAGGWLLLVATWTGQLTWMVFVLRWYGVSRYRTLRAARVASPPRAGNTAQPVSR
jgi:hypothetical protein